MAEVKIIRSKRKTISIIIEENGSVIVRAPRFVTDKEIRNVLNEKKRWINDKVSLSIDKALEKSRMNSDGIMRVLFKGEEKIVNFIECDYIIRMDGDNININSRLQNAKRTVLTDFFKYHAYEYIAPKAHFYSKRMGLPFCNLKISNAKRRWGSCSSKGNINFAWRLIMAPEVVIDYVIIHEIAHISEMNHSERFWNIVETNYSEYKSAISWLDTNAHLLDF